MERDEKERVNRTDGNSRLRYRMNAWRDEGEDEKI